MAVGAEGIQRLTQIGGQPLALPWRERVGVVVILVPLPRVELPLQPIEASRQHGGLQQVGVSGAIRQAQLEALPIGHAHHVGAVVAGVADPAWAPSGAGGGGRCGEAPVAVHRGVGDGAQRRGVLG